MNDISQATHRTRALTVFVAMFSMLGWLQGCSLITIESPAEPLPVREINARMLTREYSFILTNAIAEEADRIFAETDDVDVQMAVLRWKINASAVCLVAATQISPMLSMLDTWAFSLQMEDFLKAPEQADMFGTHQANAIAISEQLSAHIRDVARRTLTRDEFSQFGELVIGYAENNALSDLSFQRMPLMDNRDSDADDALFEITTVGTAAEAMSDIADRMRLYGDLIPQASRWQLDLLMLETGLSSDEIREAVYRIDSHMSRLADFTDASPAMLNKATRDLAVITQRASRDLEKSSLAVVLALSKEREAILQALEGQGDFFYDSVDKQRAALTADLERMSGDMTTLAFDKVDALISTAGLYIILLYIVFFTMPFVAGYFVGRARGRSSG